MIIDSFVSNKCNLKCRHCYFGDARPISESVSLARWRSFLDEAIGMGMKHFHFSGKESFLDNRIFDILNLLAEYKEDRKIFYGVVSNGMSSQYFIKVPVINIMPMVPGRYWNVL